MVEATTKVSIDLGRPVFQQFTVDSPGSFSGYLKLEPNGDVAIFLSRVLGVALENVSYTKVPVLKVREVKMDSHSSFHEEGEIEKEGLWYIKRKVMAIVCTKCKIEAYHCNFKGQTEKITDTTSVQVTLSIKVGTKTV